MLICFILQALGVHHVTKTDQTFSHHVASSYANFLKEKEVLH